MNTNTQVCAPKLHLWAFGLCLGGMAFALAVWLMSNSLSFRVRQVLVLIYAAALIVAGVLGVLSRRERLGILSTVLSGIQFLILVLIA